MEFRVLGDLEVRHDGEAIPLGAHQQRAVLAILVMHAGEVVSGDRLVDELWGDEPPSRAAKTVQVYVSRLRKALTTATGTSSDPIVTRDHGYVLRVDPAQVDLRVFERLLEEGRRAHAERAFERAADVLREALALWRGPPLADFTFDSFAAREIARLDELRLEALELRIDADLELGRHAALVAELETLTAEHPLRERLCAQRMLALYRSGRQSEALAFYTATRRLLVDELGIEPNTVLRELQQAMLRQDPSLQQVLPPTRPIASASDRVTTGRRRWLAPTLAGAALAAGLVALVALLTHQGDAGVSVGANSVAVIDPARNAVVGQVPVGVRPGDISSGAGGIWVANLDDDSVSQIDPRRAKVVRTLSTGTSVDGLTTAGGAVWTMDAPDAIVLRIDPAFANVVKRIHVGKPHRLGGFPQTTPIAAGSGSVWASTGVAAVARIASRSGDIEATADVGNEPAGIADGAGATWVADDLDHTVSRIDRSGIVTTTIPVGQGASAIAVGAGAVWVANTADGNVTRIDPVTSAAKTTIDVGAGPTGIAVGFGAVWVANSLDGTVSRIDPLTDRVVERVEVGGSPDHVAVAAGRVWVSVQAGAPRETTRAGGTLHVVQQKDFNSTDPAILTSFGSQAAQLEFATCAKLLDYPDRPAPQGSKLVPEVAAAMPTVSADGRTYAFTIRRGFRFSPPSNQPVTAHAFQRALERFLSPTMQPQDDLAVLMANVAGYGAYRSGRASHVAGIAATNSTLTIRLTHRDPSLPARITMPYFCAVPPGTPIRANGIDAIPSAGPYYIALHDANRELVLRRNPNYHGSRPRRLAQIHYRFGVAPQQGTSLVESGQADYANAAIGDRPSSVSDDVKARLDRRYGRHSPAARAGHQRYFINRTLAVQYLLLNSRRPLLASTRMRQAVNFALDRSALAKTAGPGYSGLPTDQYLPTGMPGFRDADIYPLGRPNVARARRLAGGRHRHAVMYTCNLPACLNLAAIVRANLGDIGIDVEVKSFSLPLMFAREYTKGEPFDIGYLGYSVDYPDPSNFIDVPFTRTDAAFPGAGAERYKPRIAAASRLAGEQRLHAYGQLDVDLARHAAPAVAFANLTAEDFFSARIGCQVFHPIYGIDLGALCRRGQR